MNTKTLATVALTAALLAGSALTATTAHADGAAVPAGLAISGTGWNTEANTFDSATYHEDSLRHNQTYTLTMTDAASYKRLKPYVLIAARSLNALPSIQAAGIHFAVPSYTQALAEPAGAQYPAACPTPYTISLTLKKSPQSGMSWTDKCVSDYRFSAGADIWMDPDYWTYPTWFGSSATVNTVDDTNAVSHEIGHAIGMDHPAAFTLPAGRAMPLMHASNGPGTLPTNGYRSVTNAGKFTGYDVTGINKMVANGAK